MIGALALTGCADDGGVIIEVPKGAVDEAALQDGATVFLVDEIGTVEVPFSTAVPQATVDELESEIAASVSLVVSSDSTGATVDLAMANLSSSQPDAPGEFTWMVAEDRMTATITFFNGTENGLNLDAGASYTAVLQITDNVYIEKVPALSFPIAVE